MDKIILSTGTEVNANIKAIGITPDLVLTEGYDGLSPDKDLTTDEKIELAEATIDLFKSYIDKVLREDFYKDE